MISEDVFVLSRFDLTEMLKLAYKDAQNKIELDWWAIVNKVMDKGCSEEK